MCPSDRPRRDTKLTTSTKEHSTALGVVFGVGTHVRCNVLIISFLTFEKLIFMLFQYCESCKCQYHNSKRKPNEFRITGTKANFQGFDPVKEKLKYLKYTKSYKLAKFGGRPKSQLAQCQDMLKRISNGSNYVPVLMNIMKV